MFIHRVQLVADVHDRQLEMAVAHDIQVKPETYSVLEHAVQVVPLDPLLQRVQYEELSHVVQLGIAKLQSRQVVPLR